MKKRILSGILAMVMVFGMSAMVMAEDTKYIDPLNNEFYDVIENITDAYVEPEDEWDEDEHNEYQAPEGYVKKSTGPSNYGLADADGNFVIPADYTEFDFRFKKDVIECKTATGEVHYYDYSFNRLEDYQGAAELYNDGLTEVLSGYSSIFKTIDGQIIDFSYGTYNLGYFLGGTGVRELFGIARITNPSDIYILEDCEIRDLDDNYYATLHIYGYTEDEETFMTSQYTKEVYKIRFKSIIPTVQLDGNKIHFDQIPVIEEGRTLVPVRAIFEALGATLTWDEATQTVGAVKDDTEISLKINEKQAQKNDETITLDVPAKIINGRTMVPVRFIADCFGVDIEWDGGYKIVRLTSK